MIHLKIERWSFWSPETRDPTLWREHWTGPKPEPSRGQIPSDAIPAAHRRRMSSFARLAVQIASEAAGEAKPEFLVFCSQHGDLTRLREMLRDISSGVGLSPTAFSQSVHNAAAGLFTIISHSGAPVSALASGSGTFAAGWLEAEGFLVSHPGACVLLVTCDEPLPEEYIRYSSQTQCTYGLGLLLRANGEHGVTLRSAPAEAEEPLPMAPLFMAWALSNEDTLHISADSQGWIFSRAESRRD